MRRGVSLVELLVWLAVVAILGAIIFCVARGTRSVGEAQGAAASVRLLDQLKDLDDVEGRGARRGDF